LGGEKRRGDIFLIPKRFFLGEMEFYFSIPKGLFMGWGGEGLAIFKGWGTKFDNFYIILVYLITNSKVI
jgi:hypothetical protein